MISGGDGISIADLFTTDENKIRQITKQLNNTCRFPSASPKSNAILTCTFTYQTKPVSVERLCHGYLVQYVKSLPVTSRFIQLNQKKVCLRNWSLDTGHLDISNNAMIYLSDHQTIASQCPIPEAIFTELAIYRYGT